MTGLKLLLIDDDEKIRSDYTELLKDEKIKGIPVTKVSSGNFEECKAMLKEEHYDIVVLDLCEGDPSPESKKLGNNVLDEIKATAFVPVIFFTGLPQYVEELKSEIVRVCSKGDAFDGLIKEIEEIIDSGYLDLKSQIISITNEAIRSFFWDFVQPQKDMITSIKDNVSLSYLLMRRLAKMLSKEKIASLINDDRLNIELAHPMEFYVYPPLGGEYETGDIIIHNDSRNVFVILTPSCDLIDRPKHGRKADMIFLVEAKEFRGYNDFTELEKLLAKKERDNDENSSIKKLKGNIKTWMKNNRGDRYFFLPETPFIKASILDFQYKSIITYKKLTSDYHSLAKLDDPFSQAMQSAFTRYYNRVGFPDLDIDYSIASIMPKDQSL